MKLSACLRLMRFNKPVGIFLLWLPTAWALWIANKKAPSLNVMIYFFLGTVLMRAAGCVMNDIADRHIDKHINRTHMRPLTTGEVRLFEAWLLLIGLFFAAFCIVIQLPVSCFYYALIAIVITGFYPFCKRFFQAPQLILGVAFSMGIPMAYAGSNRVPDRAMILLFILNVLWIVSYDTMYAMADREDDLRIGVKSTAVLFARYDQVAILLLQIVFHSLWLLLAVLQDFSKFFYIFWLAASWILVYQQQLIRRADPPPLLYLAAFSTNTWYGLFMWVALWFN